MWQTLVAQVSVFEWSSKVTVCMHEVATYEPLSLNVSGVVRNWDGRVSVLCELTDEAVFVSLDTFYI